MVRISDGSSYFGCTQEVVDKLKVGRNEVNGIDEVQKVVTIVLASLYDYEVSNEKCVKGECDKKVEEGLKHRVANPKLKAGGREEEGRKLLS